jgi:hypothetical protein
LLSEGFYGVQVPGNAAFILFVERRDIGTCRRWVNVQHETMIHAMVTQILLGWHTIATGQTRGDTIQRLALALEAWLDEPRTPLRQLSTFRRRPPWLLNRELINI